MLLGGSGGLVAAKFVMCPKSYYTEQFEIYGEIRDNYDTTYNTPTPYDPSLACTYLCIHTYAHAHAHAHAHACTLAPTSMLTRRTYSSEGKEALALACIELMQVLPPSHCSHWGLLVVFSHYGEYNPCTRLIFRIYLLQSPHTQLPFVHGSGQL